MFLKNPKFYVILIFTLFVVLRLWGLDLPYHQDEWHWPGIGRDGLASLGSFVQPPLTVLVFVFAFKVFGPDHLRFLPFVLGIVNFWLLFFLVKKRFSLNAALWAVLFFSVGFYNVLASLMVDTDGQVLPFFFLLSAAAYYNWSESLSGRKKVVWGIVLAALVFFGFLTKASFAIAFGALALDFLYSRKHLLTRQNLLKVVLITVGLFGLFFLATLGVMSILPNANVSRPLTYWKHFAVFSNRNYLQISIQFLKALLYSSPLLLAPLLFLTKESAKKLRLFVIFLILGLIFYLALFDFSSGALDRYFQFMIVPLSIIGGVLASNIFKPMEIRSKLKFISAGFALAVGVFLLQFLPHYVPALYPKTEWFNRALGLRWNFVFPFTGGSGPEGFYISWLFMALVWLATAILAVLGLIKTNWRKPVWTMILIVGFLYNAVFIEEYLFGRINGNPNVLARNAVNFIKNNQDISKVITYNNTSGPELAKIGKYQRRLYIAPKFESSYEDILKNFKGHYLVIDIPRIHPSSPYAKYFLSCAVIYEDYSKKISAKIYDCRNAIY